MTFLIVTHDQEEAMTVADRIAVMDHGRIVQVATPAEIYEEPNSRYVADFIGDINLVEGTVTDVAEGRVRMAAEGLDTTIEIDQERAVPPGGTAWLAIRPEKMRIAADPPENAVEGGTLNALAGTVWDIAYLGDVSIYHVKLDSGTMVRAAVTNATRLVERPITWDDKVWLTFARDGGVVLTN